MPSDNSPVFEPSFLERKYFNWTNVYGCRGSGKTSFLLALRLYFGWGHDTWQNDDHSEQQNRSREWHPIIWLDFSGFGATSFEGAVLWFSLKMSQLYAAALRVRTHGHWHFDTYERCLDIIEGTCDQDVLACSLLEMVHIARHHSGPGYHSCRPIILIDEVSRPLIYAAEYGFLNEMQSFMDSFLDIDHYELDGGIITTSFAPPNVDVDLRLIHLDNVPVNDIEPLARFCEQRGIELRADYRRRMGWRTMRYFDTCIDLKDCFAELTKTSKDMPTATGQAAVGMGASQATCTVAHRSTRIALSDETLAFVREGRDWARQQRAAHEQAELERKEQERREYAAPLSDSCEIPSRFAGVRELRMDAGNPEARESLNSLLQLLYAHKGPKIVQRDVYDSIQGLNEHAGRLHGISEALQKLKELACARIGINRCSIDIHDDYWGRFDFEYGEDNREYDDLSLVKVYLSTRDHTNCVALFQDVVTFLAQTCRHRFHAKVSRYKRSDQICLWVPRRDFFALERHIASYDELVTPLPFVAYRNKLGVSREFCSWDSHNGVQATLISCYLQQMGDEASIDVLDMYSMYVRAWNGELDEDHPLTKEFMHSNAQELLILLETLDVLLGNAELTDDCLLLNGDGSLWYALGSARNWHAVQTSIERMQAREAERASGRQGGRAR